MSINVVIADDHKMVREGIRQLLEFEGKIKVTGEAGNGLECLELLKKGEALLVCPEQLGGLQTPRNPSEIRIIDGETKVGIGSAVINDYESDININVKTKKSESGASGGFMTTLAIYNALTKEDITKGKIVAGTGTIDENGNVGIIGGVQYKLSGAVKNKADIMLVPKDNYEEALEYKKEQKFDIELVSISNFTEAIEYLENWEG